MAQKTRCKRSCKKAPRGIGRYKTRNAQIRVGLRKAKRSFWNGK